MTTNDLESRIRAIMGGSWLGLTLLRSGGVNVSGSLRNHGHIYRTFGSLSEAVEKLEALDAEKDDTVYDEPA